jgi:pseudouridine synthase
LRIRINKFLSEAGVVSRREADRLILEGRIQVNNRIVEELGQRIDPESDVVSVDGKKVKKEERPVYLMLNKPAGYLVTLKDPFQRPTIRSLLPPFLGRVFPVGRLDLDSEGLLLLTNDGELAFRLSHPRFEVKKTYVVRVRGEPSPESLRRLERGVFVERRKTAVAKVTVLERSPRSSWLRLEIHEGRKREVRLMCRAVGHDVLQLRRVGFGGLALKKLKPGEWRSLEPWEIRRLKNLVGLTSE